MPKFFVWTDCGPQLWHDDLTDGNGKARLFKFKKQLDVNEEKLSLNELSEKYSHERKFEL